ncbi:MAG: hypothetical protein ACK5LS_06910, partial [Propioniciclava sp.]
IVTPARLEPLGHLLWATVSPVSSSIRPVGGGVNWLASDRGRLGVEVSSIPVPAGSSSRPLCRHLGLLGVGYFADELK